MSATLARIVVLVAALFISAWPAAAERVCDAQYNMPEGEPTLLRRSVVITGRSTNGGLEPTGAAFLIDAPKGLFLTASHLLNGATTLVAYGFPTSVDAVTEFQFERVDDPQTQDLDRFDLALLKIVGTNSDKFAQSAPFHLSGMLLGENWTGEPFWKFNVGVSHLDPTMLNPEEILRADVKRNRLVNDRASECQTRECYLVTGNSRDGDSGGPLFDQRGVVHGVFSAKQAGTAYVSPLQYVADQIIALYEAEVEPLAFDSPDVDELMARLGPSRAPPVSNLAVLAALRHIDLDSARALVEADPDWASFYETFACLLFKRRADEYANDLKYSTGIQVYASLDEYQGGGSRYVTVAATKGSMQLASIAARKVIGNVAFGGKVVQAMDDAEALGTFCAGVGPGTIDVVGTSRPMNAEEYMKCIGAGVRNPVGAKLGYEGLVFASGIGGADFAFTAADLYSALAAERPDETGALAPNFAMTWQEVNPALPDRKIAAYIPAEGADLRAIFDEKVLFEGCQEAGAFDLMIAAGASESLARSRCVATRDDGALFEIGGDSRYLLSTFVGNYDAIGAFDLEFYTDHSDSLHAAKIYGVEPSQDAVARGEYPLSRPFYIYIKGDNVEAVPGLKNFARHIVSDGVAGPSGALAEVGLVTDPGLAKTQMKIEQNIVAPE
ncbi:substrate-binding domain-containing protein [Paracoccus zhejiangensis]|nr:substrate-binding domain-containing protein [Paracoccus zhejiangensis]